MVKRFLAILGVAFLVFSSVFLPVAAEESSSTSSDDAVLRALPDFPDDGYPKRLIVYFPNDDEFWLMSTDARVIPYATSGGYATTIFYDEDPNNYAGWLQIAYPSGDDYGKTAVFYSLDFSSRSWVSSSSDSVNCLYVNSAGQYNWKIYESQGEVVYSNFELRRGDFCFFPSPSPIASSRAYLSIHTGIWQTVRGTVNKVIVVGILILLSMVLLLLLKRLTRLLMRGGIL